MNSGPGQPTQFHGVPLEERAIDSKGNRLPWALEYHESVLSIPQISHAYASC